MADWCKRHAVWGGGFVSAAVGSAFGFQWWQTMLVGFPVLVTTWIEAWAAEDIDGGTDA